MFIDIFCLTCIIFLICSMFLSSSKWNHNPDHLVKKRNQLKYINLFLNSLFILFLRLFDMKSQILFKLYIIMFIIYITLIFILKSINNLDIELIILSNIVSNFVSKILDKKDIINLFNNNLCKSNNKLIFECFNCFRTNNIEKYMSSLFNLVTYNYHFNFKTINNRLFIVFDEELEIKYLNNINLLLEKMDMEEFNNHDYITTDNNKIQIKIDVDCIYDNKFFSKKLSDETFENFFISTLLGKENREDIIRSLLLSEEIIKRLISKL